MDDTICINLLTFFSLYFYRHSCICIVYIDRYTYVLVRLVINNQAAPYAAMLPCVYFLLLHQFGKSNVEKRTTTIVLHGNPISFQV